MCRQLFTFRISLGLEFVFDLSHMQEKLRCMNHIDSDYCCLFITMEITRKESVKNNLFCVRIEKRINGGKLSWDAWGVDKEANRIDLPMILYNAIYFVRQCIWIETLETYTIQATRYWTTNSTEIFYVSCQGLAHRFAESGVRGRTRLAVPTITTTQLIAPFIRHANRPHDYCYSFFFSFSFSAWFSLILLCNSRSHVGISLPESEAAQPKFGSMKLHFNGEK